MARSCCAAAGASRVRMASAAAMSRGAHAAVLSSRRRRRQHTPAGAAPRSTHKPGWGEGVHPAPCARYKAAQVGQVYVPVSRPLSVCVCAIELAQFLGISLFVGLPTGGPGMLGPLMFA